MDSVFEENYYNLRYTERQDLVNELLGDARTNDLVDELSGRKDLLDIAERFFGLLSKEDQKTFISDRIEYNELEESEIITAQLSERNI